MSSWNCVLQNFLFVGEKLGSLDQCSDVGPLESEHAQYVIGYLALVERRHEQVVDLVAVRPQVAQRLRRRAVDVEGARVLVDAHDATLLLLDLLGDAVLQLLDRQRHARHDLEQVALLRQRVVLEAPALLEQRREELVELADDHQLLDHVLRHRHGDGRDLV